ncbi:hypothetical protein ACFQE4_11560 [Streptomyces thermocoprophilus]|uniref:hypothetical protein n=1 Tax=Streptomyces thermocoprophilus TaxID=78356 RepID=UPI00361C8B7D
MRPTGRVRRTVSPGRTPGTVSVRTSETVPEPPMRPKVMVYVMGVSAVGVISYITCDCEAGQPPPAALAVV